jgi:SAM-dependent methyltransferase
VPGPSSRRPVFENDQEQVTRKAAGALASCYRSLVGRKVDQPLAQRFVLQTMMALFSEDIGVVEGGRFFAEPARIELNDAELGFLASAAETRWNSVRPDIFGALFEQSIGEPERAAAGAHYTSPVDIMRIVGPTIVEPWQEMIDGANTIEKLDALLDRMLRYRVLDPACGSGNFLYVAYRELKRLEAAIHEKRTARFRSDPRKQRQLRFVSVHQFYGMDTDAFAIELAKASLVVAHKLVIDELKLLENALPLDSLSSNFRVGDALMTEGSRTPWFASDVIIGNPPFLGSKRLKPERGSAYANALRRMYPDVPGLADYCVYWFRRAHDELPPCTDADPLAGRAGLVGTQNVRNNQSRVGGLDHICKSGTIVEAVQNEPWSGDAKVHVSIVNWIKATDGRVASRPKRLWTTDDRSATKPGQRRAEAGALGYELSFREVPQINSALSDGIDVSARKALACNKDPKRCFQGKIPGYDGFLLDRAEADRIRADSAPVVVPYVTGRELLGELRIERWAIDFGARDLSRAAAFPSALAHCEQHVLPAVRRSHEAALAAGSDMASARKDHLDRWWQFWNVRVEMSEVLSTLPRYFCCSRVTRRPIFIALSPSICPSDLVQVFAFADDYSFGILQSAAHFEWFRSSSRLKVESDLRYSVREVFETFPWPQGAAFEGPSVGDVLAVAEAAVKLRALREQLLATTKGGLRAIYRALELPGPSELRAAHEALDAAVAQAYGLPRGGDVMSSLFALNAAVAQRIAADEPIVAPGVPPCIDDPTQLVTTDCFTGAS